MKRYRIHVFLAAVIAVFAVTATGSADEPLVTDRPDFTESPSTVGAGISWRLGG